MAVNGRTPGSFGSFGTPLTVSGSDATPAPGQPAMIRTQGVPTGPGYRDRIGKWNFEGIKSRLTKVFEGFKLWRPNAADL